MQNKKEVIEKKKTSYEKILELEKNGKECLQWRRVPEVNPVTKRKVVYMSPTYKFLREKCGDPLEEINQFSVDNCLKWKRNPNKNPVTNRPLYATSDLYKAYERRCKNINPKKFTLFDFQRDAIEKMKEYIKKNQVVINSSEMGTGKTITTVVLAKELGLKLLVICPDAVRQSWIDTIDTEKVDTLTVTNYESIRGQQETVKKKESNPKCYKGLTNEKQNCPYVEVEWIMEYKKPRPYYTWKNIPENTLIVIDEAHKAKNVLTSTSRMVQGIRRYLNKNKKCYMVLLTGTPLDKEQNYKYIQNLFALEGKKEEILKFIKDKNIRMTIDDYKNEVQDKVKKIDFITEMVEFSEEDAKKFESLAKKYEAVKKQEEETEGIAKYVKLRRMMELLKVPYAVEFIKKHLKQDKNKKILVFTNFLETIREIEQQLNNSNIENITITGEDKMSVRNIKIDSFNKQNSKIPVMMLTIASGGTGINLQDKFGNRPRISLVFPTWSMNDLVQTFGRTERVNSKSQSQAYILFGKGEDNNIEQCVKQKLDEKMNVHRCVVDTKFEDILENIRDTEIVPIEIAEKYKERIVFEDENEEIVPIIPRSEKSIYETINSWIRGNYRPPKKLDAEKQKYLDDNLKKLSDNSQLLLKKLMGNMELEAKYKATYAESNLKRKANLITKQQRDILKKQTILIERQIYKKIKDWLNENYKPPKKLTRAQKDDFYIYYNDLNSQQQDEVDTYIKRIEKNADVTDKSQRFIPERIEKVEKKKQKVEEEEEFSPEVEEEDFSPEEEKPKRKKQKVEIEEEEFSPEVEEEEFSPEVEEEKPKRKKQKVEIEEEEFSPEEVEEFSPEEVEESDFDKLKSWFNKNYRGQKLSKDEIQRLTNMYKKLSKKEQKEIDKLKQSLKK